LDRFFFEDLDPICNDVSFNRYGVDIGNTRALPQGIFKEENKKEELERLEDKEFLCQICQNVAPREHLAVLSHKCLVDICTECITSQIIVLTNEGRTNIRHEEAKLNPAVFNMKV
jgi:hypothetical protein